MVEVMRMMRSGCSNWKKPLFLAIALILVIALVFAPMASAAKDSDSSKRDHGNDKKDDNLAKEKKDKKNDGDNNGVENVTPIDNIIDNNLEQDFPDESDNDIGDLFDNANQPDNGSEQLENVFLSDPVSQEDNVQDQPQTDDGLDQLNDSNGDYSEEEQPLSQPEEEQPVGSTDYQTQDSQNVLELESKTDIYEQPSENQVDFESSPDTADALVQGTDSDQAEQTNDLSTHEDAEISQQQQAVLETAPQTGTVGFKIWFSEELSVLGLGLGTFLVVSLAHAKIQQKYMLQILKLKSTVSSYFISTRKALEKTYLVHLHFGKIKCRAGFTKEEALAFFRECQRIPISFSNHY
ncbi:MAG: hypothetical protein QW835_04790 [Candidatus Hadarchaeum sp.]|uniref:hypothetical protein n=1 Tax=Candidatus Hadarchaeum sp. TaxID=2883567 RepID=UPI003180F7A7